MREPVRLADVARTPLLALRRRATRVELSRTVPEACGVVWSYVRDSGISSAGRNVAVYLADAAARAKGELEIEVGVEIDPGEVDAGGLAASGLALTSTPSGRAATVSHIGPYATLGEAHDAIAEWCARHGHELAGPSWEVYGHMRGEPDEPRTDVFWLLSGNGND